MLLGTYQLGHETIALYIRKAEGGECAFSEHKIVVGTKGDWDSVCDTLLHELTEYALFRNGCTYKREDFVTDDPNAICFHFTHSQFSNIISAVARVYIQVLPQLSKNFKKGVDIKK